MKTSTRVSCSASPNATRRWAIPGFFCHTTGCTRFRSSIPPSTRISRCSNIRATNCRRGASSSTTWCSFRKRNPRACSRGSRLRLPGLERVIERAAARARSIDQHRHVSRRVLILPHHLVRGGDLFPRKHLAHAGVDATVEHELVCGTCLLEMREVRALDALLPHPHIARIEGEVITGGAGAEDHHAAALDDQ